MRLKLRVSYPSLEDCDRVRERRQFTAAERGLTLPRTRGEHPPRTGVPSTWRNPDNGNQYVVTPTKTHETASGPCREYTIDAVIGGKPDGSWKIQG